MKTLRIIFIVTGIILIIGWFLFKTVAAVIPLTKLIPPLIILGIVIGVWIKFTEKVKNFLKLLAGIDLVKKLFQTSLLLLVYIAWFYFSYLVLPPTLSKVSQLSYIHTLIGINFLQIFAVGAGYYLLSSIWKETGKIARGFWIISIVGSLVISFFHPDIRPILKDYIEGFWQKKEIVAKTLSRPLVGVFEVPAGTLVPTGLLFEKGDNIRYTQVASKPKKYWIDNETKENILVKTKYHLTKGDLEGQIRLRGGTEPTKVYIQILPR